MKGAIAVVMLLAFAACGDDDDDSGTPIDAATPDAAAAIDAGTPDAGGLCGAEFLFTGDYVDWDSIEADFDGVEFAEFVEVGNDANTAMTAPNGRIIMCIASGEDFDVLATQGEYLPMRFGVSVAAEGIALFQARGARPARMDTFYTDDLGLTRNTALTTVVVNAPADATVAIDAANEGSVTYDLDPRFRVFGNVAIGADVNLTVTPPAGQTCQHRASIAPVADGISYTHVACE